MHVLNTLIVIILCCEYTTGTKSCPDYAIKVDDRIQRGKVLENAAFWSGKMEEITDCAVGCVRRKVCRSFNYEMLKKRCDLNSMTGEETFREATESHVHSYISDWPLSEIDPLCSSRPCTDHQVCLPQIFGSQDNCGYMCIDLTIYKSKCFGEASCRIINGICKEGLCECPGGKKYDGAKKECIAVCRGNLEELYPEAEDFIGTVEERNFTCKDSKIKVVSKLECRVDPIKETSNWYPKTDICVEVYGSNCDGDKSCEHIKAVCKGHRCQCPKYMFYDVEEKECKEILFQLVPGRGGNGYNTGRLLMKNESSWYNVQTDNWNLKITQHVCTAINPAFVYGGSFHGPDVYGKGATPPETIKIGEPDCDITHVDDLFNNCNLQLEQGHDKSIGLTCLTRDITTIYKSKCSGEAICQMINGICKDGFCTCPGGKNYGVKKECIAVCEGNLKELYPDANVLQSTDEERNFTCKNNMIKTVSKLECRVDPGTETSSWYPKDNICVDVHGSSCEEAPCEQISATCTNNACQCPSYMFYDPKTKQCKEILQYNGDRHNKSSCESIGGIFNDDKCECDEDKSYNIEQNMCLGDESWPYCGEDGPCEQMNAICTSNTCHCSKNMYFDMEGKVCKKMLFQLVHLVHGNRVNGYNTGWLQMEYQSSWHHVKTDNWNREMTEYVCTAINPSFVYGVSFHHQGVYWQGQTIKIGNPDCDIAYVEDPQKNCNLTLEDDNSNDIVSIWCTTDITMLFQLVHGNGYNTGQLLMKYHPDHSWHNVKTENWNWMMTQYVCQALDPSFVYGGSYHGPDVYGQKYTPKTIKIGNPGCNIATVEDSQNNCMLTLEDDHGNTIGLTCFTANITNAISFDPGFIEDDELSNKTCRKKGLMWCGFCFKDCNTNDSICEFTNTLESLRCEGMCEEALKHIHQLGNIVKDIHCNGDETNILFCMNGGFWHSKCNNTNILLMNFLTLDGTTFYEKLTKDEIRRYIEG